MVNATQTRNNETKNEKFRRLAESRVNTVLDRLRLLGQLADKKNYEYTDEQVSKIFRAIDSELKDTKSKFQKGSAGRKRFTL